MPLPFLWNTVRSEVHGYINLCFIYWNAKSNSMYFKKLKRKVRKLERSKQFSEKSFQVNTLPLGIESVFENYCLILSN